MSSLRRGDSLRTVYKWMGGESYGYLPCVCRIQTRTRPSFCANVQMREGDLSTERNTMLMRLSEWDKMLAVTKDPLELKKGSEAIEAVRSMARLAHLGVEIVNMAFAERVKWDRKRGQWIEENIPKHNEKNDSWSTSRLKDIDTSWDESAYCPSLDKTVHQHGSGRLDPPFLCQFRLKKVFISAKVYAGIPSRGTLLIYQDRR